MREGIKTVYLSGPISLGGSATPEDESRFKKRFKQASFHLEASGYVVIDPTECEPQDSWEAYMKIHIPKICGVDGLVMLPLWERSKGAVLEFYLATQLRIPVFYARDLGA